VGEESDQLRREIDETRRELGTDVDALTEKVSPSRVVGRRVDKARDAVGGLKEKVMGTTSDATSSAGDGISSAASTVGDKAGSAAGSVQGAASSAASTVADTASSTAQAARRGAEGNPLAAGVIATPSARGRACRRAAPPRRRRAHRLGRRRCAAAGPVRLCRPSRRRPPACRMA
jgi:hypothetical protein